MADTPATLYSDLMTNLTGNSGGAVQTLNKNTLFGGRVRKQTATLTLASQASGSVFGMFRIPLGSVISSISVITDTSLGSTTIKFGDAHNGNSAIYGAAATLTATDTKTRMGPPTAKTGVEITTGYDSQGTLVNPTMPQTPGQGGFNYEDIIMTTGAATAPASGTLRAEIEYTEPGS